MRGFAVARAPVLDCAHGSQKENQKNSEEVEASGRQESDAEEATAQAAVEEEIFQKAGSEKARS